ncbi:MAG TPA: hypothetical protein VLA04_01015 [Verrucomicrobiae bacterium]|nr:hypothetical protein [Verrucomicrobiae bacterium]
MKTVLPTLGKRVGILEKDAEIVHQALEELNIKVDVVEKKMERGFVSLEKRFDGLEGWLKERL